MSPSPPFVDPGTGTLDYDRILVEAAPIAKLIGLFVAVALVPFAVGVVLLSRSGIGLLFAVVGQFVLAVGAAVVLLYVIQRALQLSEETTPVSDSERP
jgi:hypothetical protein